MGSELRVQKLSKIIGCPNGKGPKFFSNNSLFSQRRNQVIGVKSRALKNVAAVVDNRLTLKSEIISNFWRSPFVNTFL